MKPSAPQNRDWPYSLPLDRVLIVGVSGAGKSTFARSLAAQLRQPVIELDALYWGPNWTPKPTDAFRHLADVAAAAPRWVADGNYSAVRDLLWPRAGTVFWLNYPFHVVMARALTRTVQRSWQRTELWHGNRESFGKSFLSRDSILLYAAQNWARKRQQFAELRASAQHPHLTWIEFQNPQQAEGFLHSFDGGAETRGMA
ncbi:MAG: toxin [Panacagrimonas sp.]